VIKKATAMFEKLFPKGIDNSYRGSKVALWLFGLVVGMKITQSLAVIFNGYYTAKGADGIPLDTFTPAAAQTAVAIFAQASLWRLTFCLMCVLALVRYRSSIPLLFVLFVLNYLTGELIFRFVPLVRTGTPLGPTVNLILFALMVIGLALSLRSPRVRS
jgi:ABC-type amino acid transport system permease subunit